MLSSFAKSVMTVGTAATCLLMAASSASAFTFQTNWSGTPPKGDIYLDSVEIGGEVITNFALVNEVTDLQNPDYTGGNSGAASSDLGDDATVGIADEDPGYAEAAAALGNRYLSSIIDTEDSGIFSMTFNFDKAFDRLLFWERGHNSDIDVTINGHTETLYASNFDLGKTTYKLDTTEIGGAQEVGSYGLDLSVFGISGAYNGPVTVATKAGYNGPDFKVVGVAVPEPATVLGLTAVAGAFVASRRRKSDRPA